MLKKTILLLAIMVVSMCNATDSAMAARHLASPALVTLSPNIAHLIMNEKITAREVAPETSEIKLTVPASVNPDTFSVRLGGFEVANVSFMPLMPEDDDPASPRGALIAKIAAAQAEQARLEGEKKSLEARIALWTAKPSDYSGSSQAPDLDKIDAGLGARLPDLYAALAPLPDKINALAERIQYYERDLAAMGGKRQQLAEVTVAFNGKAPAGGVNVEYSYYAYGCGWQPVYGFSAAPEKSSLDFRQQAYIWQSTGQDWNGARVTLSTKAPDFRLAPGKLRIWTMYREEEAKPQMRADRSVANDESIMAYAAAPAQAKMSQPTESPVSMQRSSHLEWNLGPRVIPSGAPVTLTLQEDVWQAEFYYTLRPSLGQESFVTAKVKLPKAVELSRGRAVFSLDSRLCGTDNNFAANSDEFELYFGTDDRVTVETIDLLKQRGKEGFFTTTNTFNWEWQFTVKNRRDRTIAVRVEDPMPQAADSSIKIKTDSTPQPETEKLVYFWKADLEAGQDLVIIHKVNASASGQQRLIPGR